MFFLDPDSPTSLVNQIVSAIKQAIEDGRLAPGSKLPSIRRLAQSHGISHFTVVEAYDRLVAQGYLKAERNAGFFVHGQPAESNTSQPDTGGEEALDFDTQLLLRKVFHSIDMDVCCGVGTLPESWLQQNELSRAMRSLARENPAHFYGYGTTKGHPRLRAKLADILVEANIGTTAEQILLTSGASQALDLVSRYLVQRDDPVLVDQPGYHNLFFNLRLQGARLIGVERSADGIDFASLEANLQRYRPRVYFTQPRLQSPTGTSLSPATAHRLLQLADKYDFLIVENDIYASLDPQDHLSLAALDQLSRVIHIGSFSKVVAPALRCGYITAHPDLIDELDRLKMACGLTSSELTESLVLEVLLQGRQRKHIKHLQEQLADAHANVAARMKNLGLQLFHEPHAGLFLWIRHPAFDDATQLARLAQQQRILLSPGTLFMPDASQVPWMRFNVAHAQDPRLYRFLEQQAEPL